MNKKLFRFEAASFIWSNVNRKRKIQLLLILPIVIIGALAESISILAVVPFILKLVNNRNSSFDNYFFNFISDYLPNKLDNIFIFLSLIIILAIFFRLISIYAYNYWSALLGSDISHKSFNNFSSLEYPKYKESSLVKVTNLLQTSVNYTIATVVNYLTIFIGLVTSFGFLITGLIVNTKAFIFIFLILLICYSFIMFYTKGTLKKIGFIQQQYVQNSYNFINYIYGTFKDIKLENSNRFIDDLYLKNDLIRRKNGSLKKVISLYPKILIEGIAILLIAFFIKFLTSNNNYAPEIGVEILVISLIFSRLLPVFQIIYSSWSDIKVSTFSVLKLKEFYEENNFPEAKIIFKNTINNFDYLEILNLSYSYKNKNVLNNINLKINKGEWLGIYGKSGSGKSTLIDLMMGLLKTNKGQIFVNNYDINESKFNFGWRSLIAHCPPDTYLMETDVISNIVPIYEYRKDLNYIKLKKAWHSAGLDEFLSLENELNFYKNKKTNFQERSLIFSSGQKQRIVIARTLYRDKEVLFLDEFTSSLDNKIEKIVIKRIKENYPDKTVVLVSHNKYPLQFCDKLIEL